MIIAVLVYMVGIIVGYAAFSRHVAIKNRLDPRKIGKLAVAIRKGKNAHYAQLVANTPYGTACGPPVRHIYFEVI